MKVDQKRVQSEVDQKNTYQSLVDSLAEKNSREMKAAAGE